MSSSVTLARVPWWKEPTKDQWIAWWAAWLGWTLDAFDFTIFLLIMVPIANEFNVPLTAVAVVFTLTLWLRLVGATASGWLADRVGRKIPLMISILWYSICNFIAGFSPSFAFLFFFRALLGIGMGAEWPAGASLAMESWPVRSRGFMSGVLQGSWGLGFLLSALVYGLLTDHIGWRGMLWIGILPALAVVWVRKYVKEPRSGWRTARSSASSDAKCVHRCSSSSSGSSLQHADRLLVDGELHGHLLLDLGAVRDAPAEGPRPGAADGRLAAGGRQLLGFWCHGLLGLGRRRARPAVVDDHSGGFGIFITPIYLLTTDPIWIIVGLSGSSRVFAGAIYSQMPSYLTERFPTEVRATASAFCYHQGAILGGARGASADLLRGRLSARLRHPDADRHHVGLVSVVISLLVSPETKGHVFQSDLVVT